MTDTVTWPPILISEEFRLSNQYLQRYGVVFSSGAPFVSVHLAESPGYAPSPPNYISGSRPDGFHTNSSEYPVVARFFNPDDPTQKATTSYVSVTTDLLGTSPDSTSLKAYDVNGNEIGSVTKPDTGGVVLSLSLQGIHEVRFIGTTDWNGVAIDNFTFTFPYFESANTPPTADAGNNLTIQSYQVLATTIHGSVTDTDAGDILTYKWLEGDTVQLDSTPVGANGDCPLSLAGLGLSLGTHNLILEISDGKSTISDEMILSIGNSEPNAAPSGEGSYDIGSIVTLSGEVSDFDGDLLTYTWLEGSTVLGFGTVQSIFEGTAVNLPNNSIAGLGLGDHTITLEVTDEINAVVKTITVTIKDDSKPTIAPVADPLILWPPNHKMVNISINANASDNSGLPVVLTANVSSNEPVISDEDGDLSPDWTQPVINQATGVITLQLRAERSGKGSGREYSISIAATDYSGNSSIAVVTILVPHDQSKK